MRLRRVAGDSRNVWVHLINIHLAEACFGQFAVQKIQCTLGGNDARCFIDAVAPFLVLAFLVDDVNLQNVGRLLIGFVRGIRMLVY